MHRRICERMNLRYRKKLDQPPENSFGQERLNSHLLLTCIGYRIWKELGFHRLKMW